MANVNAPRGFTPVKYRSGAPYNGAANKYYKSASVILGIGDPVIRTATSASPEGYAAVTRATTGAAITGIVVGIDPLKSDLSKQGSVAAAVSSYVYVADDPNLLFEVQEGGSGTALAINDIGLHIDAITAVDADVVIGRSKYQIDNGAVATGNTFRLEQLVQRSDNALGAYAKWLVSPNLHTEVNASATNLTEV